jgi:hypothetical protein
MIQSNQIFSKNKFIILSLLLAALLLMSAATAAEADFNNTSLEDEDLILTENSEDVVIQEINNVSSFDDLSGEIENTPENHTLTLDKDYQYVNGSDGGIVISKPIAIDGAGHTLDGKKSSRIFNITADNVILKNINFINGNAKGSYFTYYGGGAIFWNGTNGSIENCTFSGNTALDVDYDPYDKDEVIEGENGMTIIIHNERPLGRTINQGGAISWYGDSGTVSKCTFSSNHVAYPDDGGAIFWKGRAGKVIRSKFFDNSAYRGSAIYWEGANGTVLSSVFYNSGICDEGLFWTGANGVVMNSILLSKGNGCVIYPSGNNVNANLNFWGDTIENPNQAKRLPGISNWILMNLTSDRNLVLKGEEFTVSYDLTTLTDRNNARIQYLGLDDNSGHIRYVANETALVKVSFEKNQIKIDLSPIGFFDELSEKINATPEGGLLLLDKDYRYLNGSNKGILITKPITIDGADHTLDGCKLSRMFNVTSDNVTIKNINFVNGNAFGRYFQVAGGGAVYWYGANGLIENCNFINNTGSGVEDDPFDKEETFIDENGTVWFIYRSRPMGCKINEGGAIVWNGTDGTVSNCLFVNNAVGYPNTGGAICWRGSNGKVIDSEFYKNDAWCGSAIAWIGDNGLIYRSIIANSSFFDGGIYWFGHNGTVKYCLLFDSGFRSVLRPADADVKADYNFWGDSIGHSSASGKISSVNNWFVMRFTHNGEYVEKGQTVLIEYDITNLMYRNGKMVRDDSLNYKIGQLTYTATKNGFLDISYKNGQVAVLIDSRDAVIGKNVSVYYPQKVSYKVTVYDVDGKVVSKYVKFKVNKKTYNVKTNRKGVAALKLKLKPGKYTVYASYGDVKIKNRITVKTCLITKNLKIKSKKSGKFTVKVLNSKGKAYAKQSLKVKFRGKTYKLKTDKKGKATFKVPKNLKKGKYTIKTSYKDLTNSNKIVVKK